MRNNNIIIIAISLFSLNVFAQNTYGEAYQKLLNYWVAPASPVTHSSNNFPACTDEQAKRIFAFLAATQGEPDATKIDLYIQRKKPTYNDLVANTQVKSSSGSGITGAKEALEKFKQNEKDINNATFIKASEYCAKSVSHASNSGVWDNSTATAFNNVANKTNDTSQTGASCGLDGKDTKTRKPCSDTQEKNKPVADSSLSASTGALSGATYTALSGSKSVDTTFNGKHYTVEGRKVYETVNGEKVEVKGDTRDQILDQAKDDRKEQRRLDKVATKAELEAKKVEAKKHADELKSAKADVDLKCGKDPKSDDCKVAEKLADSQKSKLDNESKAAIDNEETQATEASNQAQTQLVALRSKIQELIAQYDEKHQAEKTTCEQALIAANSLDAPVKTLTVKNIKCKSTGAIAKPICKIVTNPAVKMASTFLAAASTQVANSSASEVCESVATTNAIGQSLVMGGSLTCGVFGLMCKTSCGNSIEAADTINSTSKTIAACIDAKTEHETFTASINSISTSSKDVLAGCEKHKVDEAQLATMAMGMGSIAAQGKTCQDKLSALEGSNNSAQVYTMDEMCAQPQNASSSICKCRADNTAPGCPGYIAGSGNEGNINKDLNSKGLSQMAGLSYKSKISPTSGSGLDTNLDGLSDEAKKALAAGGDQKQDAAMFGGAGAANAGGGAGTASAGGGAAGADKVKMADEPKSFGSSFMNAVGSLFKGGSGSKGATAKDDKFASDKYKEQIKRQIAAEQMRSEISSASGMDNWTKIRTRYKSNAASLIDSN